MPLLTPAHPDWPKLFQPSAPVTDYAKQVQPYLRDMRNLMERKKRLGGLGMSGCQVGSFFRFFIFGGKYFGSSVVKLIINPTNVKQFGEMTKYDEGCLSFQDRFKTKERHDFVSFNYENIYSEKCQYVGTQVFVCRVIQHEIDHLDGITLFGPDEPVVI